MKSFRTIAALILTTLMLAVAATTMANAQVFTNLVTFDVTNGAEPNPLIQGADGNFYGTTYEGGDTTCFAPVGCGTVFTVTPAGALTTLHIFEFADGLRPSAGLVLATDGNFYGTTANGGSSACGSWSCSGTVFKITSDGTLTTLYNFCSQYPNHPQWHADHVAQILHWSLH